MRYRLVIGACSIGMAGFIFAMAPAAGPTATAGSGATAQPTRAQLRARDELVAQIMRLIEQREYASARALVQGMISDPLVEREVVDGHRFLSMIARREGDLEAADGSLVDALAALAARPALAARSPWMRPMVIMDQADLAAFGRGDRELAVGLYDQVLAERETARPRDVWIAAQNAAMLCVDLGRIAEAARRVDDLLASPAASEIPPNELVALRISRANWPAQAGDLPAAFQQSLALWNEYQHRDDSVVFDLGLRVARWCPTPQRCNERLAIASTLLSKIGALRANPSSNPAAPTAAQLDALDHQTLVLIADSDGCQSPLIAWARAALGLPPSP